MNMENSKGSSQGIFMKMEELYRKLNDRINKISNRIKQLEQAKTYYPMIEQSKHQILFKNCVDDDEAILHKREIKKNEERGE